MTAIRIFTYTNALLVAVTLAMVLADIAITLLVPGWRPGLCGRDCRP